MIDPVLSLSFSLHTNKGVYALLLGSGVSRAAGIPTGWEVTLDLIRKLAHMKGENSEPDPAKWYAETFTEEADYSKVLKLVAKTSSERSHLLKGYFEPTEDERQQGIKTPTIAHKAIAGLVAKGYVKVILTTNFDRLMEKALEESGVIPTIISTTDAIRGATPITHTTCTLIKLHGDYLDTRIKNTPEELSSYDKSLNDLLDRIFDEFGLIICGWSGDWDNALCDALQRSKSRRFTTYWTVKDSLSNKAKELADFRKAEVIQIQAADIFFTDLSEKLYAINEFERPHPLSAQAAAVTFKRYLEDEKYKIRMHDLITQEVDKLSDAISPKIYPTQQPAFDKDEFLRRVNQLEAKTETLQAIMITGGYWGKQNESYLFTKSLERLANKQKEQGGYTAWVHLQLYPSLILLFSAGLSALASENYDMLAAVMLKPEHKDLNLNKEPLILSLYPSAVIEQNDGRLFPNMENRYTPASDHLVEILAQPLREYIQDQLEFENLFDKLEYFIGMVVMDHYLQSSKFAWAPIGRFGWKGRHYSENIITKINNELTTDKGEWKLLKSGFFGGSIDRALKAHEKILEQLKQPIMY